MADAQIKGPIPEEGFIPDEAKKYKDRLSRWVVTFWEKRFCQARFTWTREGGYHSTCSCGRCSGFCREVLVPSPVEVHLKKYRDEVFMANRDTWYRTILGPRGPVRVCLITAVTADFIGE